MADFVDILDVAERLLDRPESLSEQERTAANAILRRFAIGRESFSKYTDRDTEARAYNALGTLLFMLGEGY